MKKKEREKTKIKKHKSIDSNKSVGEYWNFDNKLESRKKWNFIIGDIMIYHITRSWQSS